MREKVREARLRCIGHVQMRNSGFTGQWMFNMELPDGWKSEKPQTRFMDIKKKSMQRVDVTEKDVRDIGRWW